MASKRSIWLLAAVLTAGALVAIGRLPTTTERGVNHVVTSHRLPLYAKVLDFVDRDVNYRQLASQITAGTASDAGKLQALFDWTRANIRDTPAGFPVVDDHVWFIIVRGYGVSDQKADVFTTLLTYAGVPAYWIFIGPKPELVLSLVLVDGRWRAVDVENAVIFRTADGGLATPDDLAANRSLILRQAPAVYRGISYVRFFDRFHAPIPPDITHADMQRPFARLWFELKKVVGRRGRSWEMRPPSREGPPSSAEAQ